MTLDQMIDICSLGVKHYKELLKRVTTINPVLLLHLDDMNMRDDQLWWGYYGFCERDMQRFCVCASNRDKQMIDYVNRCAEALGQTVKAVQRGGAPR